MLVRVLTRVSDEESLQVRQSLRPLLEEKDEEKEEEREESLLEGLFGDSCSGEYNNDDAAVVGTEKKMRKRDQVEENVDLDLDDLFSSSKSTRKNEDDRIKKNKTGRKSPADFLKGLLE